MRWSVNCKSPADLIVRVRRMIKKTCRWEMRRIPATGEIDLARSTLTGLAAREVTSMCGHLTGLVESAGGHLAKVLEQLLCINWFRDVAVHSRSQTSFLVALHRAGRHGDDRKM